MKKVIISLLLVLATVCLFVGCSSDQVKTVSFAFAGETETKTVTFNKDGSGSYTVETEEDKMIYPFATYVFSSDKATGLYFELGATKTDIVVGSLYCFYKNYDAVDARLTTLIKDFDALVELDSIFCANEAEEPVEYTRVEL